MNILGIGAPELIMILLVMLIFAGPKRMARWAFVAGQYTAKAREMWRETSKVLKDEFQKAGLDPDMVDTLGDVANPRTRNQAINKQLDSLVGDMKAPLEEAVAPLKETVEEINSFSSDVAKSGNQLASAVDDAVKPEAAEESKTESGTDQSKTGQYGAWTAN